MSPTATADALDAHPDAQVCTLPFGRYGGRAAFAGPIATLRCFEDNVLLKQRVAEPGKGRVLVVDGGGSMRVALMGDMVAGLAAQNGWAGVVVNGCVRDVAELRRLRLGIKALGPCPRPSGKDGTGEIDVPVSFGGVTFCPGDVLVGDDDGVVVVATT